MVDLKVMAYFKLSLSTRNWDSAMKKPCLFRQGFFASCLATSWHSQATSANPAAGRRPAQVSAVASGSAASPLRATISLSNPSRLCWFFLRQ